MTRLNSNPCIGTCTFSACIPFPSAETRGSHAAVLRIGFFHVVHSPYSNKRLVTYLGTYIYTCGTATATCPLKDGPLNRRTPIPFVWLVYVGMQPHSRSLKATFVWFTSLCIQVEWMQITDAARLQPYAAHERTGSSRTRPTNVHRHAAAAYAGVPKPRHMCFYVFYYIS